MFDYIMSEEFWKASRKTTRALVTRLHNQIPIYTTFTEAKLNTTRAKLERIAIELPQVNQTILKYLFEAGGADVEANLERESQACEEYEGKVDECIFHLDVSLKGSAAPEVQQNPFNQAPPALQASARTFLRPPTAPLPTFNSGPDENFEVFIANFESTLTKFPYTATDKFLLLKEHIKGKAALLIESLDPDSQTYVLAKQFLSSALASRPVQIERLVNQLLNLKMSTGSEPFAYIGQAKKIVHSAEVIKLTVEEILNHFLFAGLNDSFKEQLILVCNSSRPTLSEFMEHFFEANDRYSNVPSPKNVRNDIVTYPSKSKSTSLALAVSPKCAGVNKQNPFANCPLCNNDSSHGINKCVKYTTPQSKINRLGVLDRCTMCTTDHAGRACNFCFRYPCGCDGYHYSFLCPKKSVSGEDGEGQNTNQGGATGNRGSSYHNRRKKNTTSTNVVVSLCGYSTYKPESVLSTFDCYGSSGSRLKGFRDMGSQNTLVVESNLSKFNYIVIDDQVSLEIKGINDNKNYVSKLVSLQLNVGGCTKELEAFTIPSISVDLDLPGLSLIARAFVDKGYRLADSTLIDSCDRISDIDILLGADAASFFEDTSCSFGKHSCYYESNVGIMLIGNLSRLLDDIGSLPHASDVSVAGSTRNVFIGLNTLSSNLGNQSKVFSSQDVETSSSEVMEDESNFNILNSGDLESKCDFLLDKESVEVENHELNDELIIYLLENTSRGPDGRLIMPLLWNNKVKHLLARNFELSKCILRSQLKKLSADPSKLILMERTIKEFEELGLIQKVDNIDDFVKLNPTCSFLGFQPIFKMDKVTSKCRLVYLSNCAEKFKDGCAAISHNQSMYSGPSMNAKLVTSLFLLRFDPKVLIFDLHKAFCSIELKPEDSNKLLFTFVKDVMSDHSLVVYRNVRLSFGLRPSPTILMAGLYKLLILDTTDDSERLRLLKRLIYHLVYMDNGAITCKESSELSWAYDRLPEIFEPYGFKVQQCCSNDLELRQKILTNSDEASQQEVVDLFGIKWDTTKDTLVTKPKKLDSDACTKRTILASIASNFDPYNIEAPLLNRSRLFMHDLQCRKELDWDEVLPTSNLREWHNICTQLNNSPGLTLPRYVGDRDCTYELIAFSDASKSIFGCVIYIKCLQTNYVNFLMSKNRIVGKNMESKTIPTLELAGIVLAVECLVDLKRELSGSQTVSPLNIESLRVFSDNIAALSWIQQQFGLDKMNKKTVFVQNRLQKLEKLCENNLITFSFVDGFSNPGDCVTRPMSAATLARTNYLTGPKFLISEKDQLCRADILTFSSPTRVMTSTHMASVGAVKKVGASVHLLKPLVEHAKISSWGKLVRIYRMVYRFIRNTRALVAAHKESREGVPADEGNLTVLATHRLVRESQHLAYEDLINFFYEPSNSLNVPNIVGQLNVFMDKDGILRVGGKMNKRNHLDPYFPILMSNKCILTQLLVREAHWNTHHGGVYNVLSRLRREFYFAKCYSTVRKIVQSCVLCKRYNSHTLKLNQSPYRDFRSQPTSIAFNYTFIDFAGPYIIKQEGKRRKVYLLVLTCLWSRAVNIRIALNMTTNEFLRCLSLHCLEFGVPSLILSDQGSNFVAGSHIVEDFLDDQVVKEHFQSRGVRSLTFSQYFKGKHELGSLIEIMVKMVRRLISGAVGSNVLDYWDFDYVVMESRHLVNRRPIAFREQLTDPNVAVPEVITPEILIYGHELMSINIIPHLQPFNVEDIDLDYDPTTLAKDKFSQMRRVRQNLIKIYNEEFKLKLLDQSISKKGLYEKVTHKGIEVEDIVLLKEENMKQSSYPMARVVETVSNDLGEITGVVVTKGPKREKLKRHVSCVIPYLRMKEACTNFPFNGAGTQDPVVEKPRENAVVHLNRRGAPRRAKERATRLLTGASSD